MAAELNGSTQYIVGSAPISGNDYPYTMHARFRANNVTNNMRLVELRKELTDIDSAVAMVAAGANGDFIRAQGEWSSAMGITTTGFQEAVWHSASGEFSAMSTVGGRSAWLDGGGYGAQSAVGGSGSPQANFIAIGVRYVTALDWKFNGGLAEVAIWTAILTDAERESLAKGFSPRRIRPQSRVFYSPLIRDLQDLQRALALTPVNNPTVAAHPRVYA